MGKYYVVVPAYNEARQIHRCIEHILEHTKNVIVVDDGSTDKTGTILDLIGGITVIHLKHNAGKGHAMKIGAKEAFRRGAAGVIFLDADNQHHPKHIPEFMRLLGRGNDIVIGVRILKAAIPWHRKLGNFIMAGLMHLLFHIYIPDMMCGYRAFTKKGFAKLEWQTSNYGVEIEMLTIIGRKKLSFKTIVVDTIYLDKYKGFSVWDGIKIMLSLPYYKWRTL